MKALRISRTRWRTRAFVPVLLMMASGATYAVPLDPLTIPKYLNQLEKPPVLAPSVVTDPATGTVISHDYQVDMTQFPAQMLPPGLPATSVWGYGGLVVDPNPAAPAGSTIYYRSSPGPSFDAQRGIPINVQWVNSLVDPVTNAPLAHLFAVDPTIHWADPAMFGKPQPPFLPFPPGYAQAQSPVPVVPHLHGGEVESASDGNPEAWFTPGEVLRGRSFVKSRYTYANTQPATTLWYHDHTLGLTRQNVYAGLAGIYTVRDPADPNAAVLPTGNYDIPLVIQDKMFNTDGSLSFPAVGINPDVHPYWMPEFFGDTMVVNGKVWPNLNVERRQYRFRILNAANARFFTLSLSNGQRFVQIGSDGGYLQEPTAVRSLTLAPGERADVLIDFSALRPGTKVTLTNSAPAPFPLGIAPDPNTVGQVMQFTVPANAPPAVTPPRLPKRLNTITALTANAPTRTVTLNEVMGALGPTMVLLNGQMWDSTVSELPRVGSTEIWEIVNTTVDTHPIHLHLVQFQVVDRQNYDSARYTTDWTTLNGTPPLMQPTVPLSPAAYLMGRSTRPADNERGWKDTVQAPPGQVTRLLVRFAPQEAAPTAAAPGVNLFSFDPTAGPGYVWHCHILDHEDNEMMRPMKVVF